ncbi:MAG: ATP-binding protein [Clostridia bacterium]|nr:ATP-binding protein [Clostridia bacterium]
MYETAKKKSLPIGTDIFSDIHSGNLYYVDKTGLIKELFDSYHKVTLFTRPRRFGKSLNMSMLEHFFKIGCDKTLFDGLEISKETEICEKHMGQYPVISITLKDAEGFDFEGAERSMWSIISFEAEKHSYLANSDKLDADDIQDYKSLRNCTGKLENSLFTLSKLLYKHHSKRVVFLIDEYDVPLDKSYHQGYYDQMLKLVRQMLGSALKTNGALEFAVLTGCLRISKESIFTGLNNLAVYSVVNDEFSKWFGFTEDEVTKMFEYYGCEKYLPITKEWYDGYRFGQTKMYCPWDVIRWCNHVEKESNKTPQNFWANTSGNDMIIKLANKADAETREEIEQLIAGKTIRKKLELELTYPEIDSDVGKPDHLWSVLFSAGYLTQLGVNDEGEYELTIPNKEIRNLFKDQIRGWMNRKIYEDNDGLKEVTTAFVGGDAVVIQDYLNKMMGESISIYDGGTLETRENFYHGLLIGVLQANKSWSVLSNREAGNGRLDIAVKPVARLSYADYGIIIEVKYAEKPELLEQSAHKALTQINEKKYDNFFGWKRPAVIRHYGIAFCGKECWVAAE